MVGPEDRHGLWRVSRHYIHNCRRRRGLGTLLVYINESFVDRVTVMYRFFVPSIPEKSAAPVKAVGIPIDARVPGSEYPVSIVNFGKYTITRWEYASCSSVERFCGSSAASAAARLSFLGRRTIMERPLPLPWAYGIESTWRSVVSAYR